MGAIDLAMWLLPRALTALRRAALAAAVAARGENQKSAQRPPCCSHSRSVNLTIIITILSYSYKG